MRTPLSKALLLAALCAPALVPAQAARVYFMNNHGRTDLIDVYLNGVLLFDNMFSTVPTMFGRDIAPGTHTFVVTTYNVPPGPNNLLETKVEVAQWGDFMLTFAPEKGTENFDRPVMTLKLSRFVEPQPF